MTVAHLQGYLAHEEAVKESDICSRLSGANYSMHIHIHTYENITYETIHLRQLRMRHTKHIYILGNKDHTLAALS